MLRLRRTWIAVAGFALATAATGLTADNASANASTNIVVIGMTSEPATLDPATGFTGFDYPYLYSIYDRLIDFEPATLELRPGLATEWRFVGADKLAFEIKLRDGVKFQDGTDCDAEAVKASLLHFKEAGRRDDIDIVTSIDVVDRLTLRLKLSREFSVLPSVLADRAGMIVSPTALKKFGKDFPRNPVGAGPFMLSKWTSGSALDLTRAPNYWDKGKIKLSGIQYRIIANPTALVSAIMAGQVDHAFNIDPKNLPVLRANPKIRVTREPTLFYYQLMLNLVAPPTDNVLVRQALNMSIDRQALLNAILGPDASEGPAIMPVPPSNWAYSKALEGSVKYDPVKAKELLAKAGYPDGVTIKICGTPILGYGPDIVDIERDQMKAAGIRLEATMLAGSACQQAWESKNEYVIRQGGFTGRPDPYLTYENGIGSTGKNNRGHVRFPGVDETLNKILSTYTRDGQKALYDQLNKAWNEYVPHVLLFYGSNVVVYSKDLAGEQPNLQGKDNPVTLYFKPN